MWNTRKERFIGHPPQPHLLLYVDKDLDRKEDGMAFILVKSFLRVPFVALYYNRKGWTGVYDTCGWKS